MQASDGHADSEFKSTGRPCQVLALLALQLEEEPLGLLVGLGKPSVPPGPGKAGPSWRQGVRAGVRPWEASCRAAPGW